MTREEQIKEAATNFMKNEVKCVGYIEIFDKKLDFGYIDEAFIIGAKWSDENPDHLTFKDMYSLEVEKNIKLQQKLDILNSLVGDEE